MHKFRAIVLKSFDFQEREKILTLFTEEVGIASMIVKRISPKNSQLINLCSPLTIAEYHCVKGKSDLYSYRDGSLIDLHLDLRKDFDQLQSAFKLLEVIKSSQIPGRASPEIFALLSAYLRQIPNFSDQIPLKTSFLLKVLFHEGLVSPRQEGFTLDEQQLICDLLLQRKFPNLADMQVPEEFFIKIENYFSQMISHSI